MDNITRLHPSAPPTDDTFTFIGFFKSDAKFDKAGICTMRMEIPWEARETVLRLLESSDWPMEITIKPQERVNDF